MMSVRECIKASVRLAPLVLVALAAALTGAGPASAQAWPSKPVRIVVPFPPGGIVDTVARQLQPGLQAVLGQPVIVDNKGGAGGTIGVGDVVRSPADGHTLVMVFDSFATYPLTYPKLGYDITKDLQPVTQVASNPLILVVHPQLPVQDLRGFIELAKSRPGKINYASVGPGSSNHLTAELFKSVTDTVLVHVPYRGGGPAQQDLLGGHVESMFLSAVLAQPYVRADKLKALAQTGRERIPAYASTPTVAESGYPGFDVNSWVGLLAPAGTPKPVVERLQTEVKKILEAPEFAARLAEQGLTGIGSSPEQFAAVLRAEQARWTTLVTERKLSLE